MTEGTAGTTTFEGATTFESVEGGTKLANSAEVEVGGFFKLAESVVARMANRQGKANYGTLKDLMEAMD